VSGDLLQFYFIFLVSSQQKRDKRTIEETLADIKAKKKQKVEDDDEVK